MPLPTAPFRPWLLSAAAPACHPCPPPAWPTAPTPVPRLLYSVGDCSRARARCREVAQQHPFWPTSRVRATVARELGLATVTLRYLLRKADEVLGANEEPPAPPALPVAA